MLVDALDALFNEEAVRKSLDPTIRDRIDARLSAKIRDRFLARVQWPLGRSQGHPLLCTPPKAATRPGTQILLNEESRRDANVE